MKTLFVALAVLAALLTEGDCLSCETCQVNDAVNCNGEVELCAENVTYCVKGLENNTMVGVSTILSAYKKCVDPVKNPACNKNIIFRNPEISLRIFRECCTKDECNKGDLIVPPIDDKPNGLVCPTCFTDQSSEGCTATGTMACVGNENYCGSFTGKANRPDSDIKGYSIKGCHNEDACEVGILAIEAAGVLNFQQNCTRDD